MGLHILLLGEAHLGARVVVGEGGGPYHTVADDGVEGALEVGDQHAIAVLYLAADGDARQHGGGVVHSFADGTRVDVGHLHAVLGLSET